MNKPRLIIFAAAILVFSSCLFSSTGKTAMLKLSLEQLTKNADSIVLGVVADKSSFWNDKHTVIYTDVTVKVERSIVGPPKENATFRIIGGDVDGLSLRTSVDPRFNVGERVIVFLSAGGDSALKVEGLFQGKYSVNKGAVIHEGKTLSLSNFINSINRIALALSGGELQ